MTTFIPVAKPHLQSNRPRLFVSILLALLLIPVASAQNSDDNTLAPSMAQALAKVKVKTVVVFDFMGPGQRLNQLGRDLADEFRRALANSGGKFQVIDRSAVKAILEDNRVAPDVIRDPEIAWWLARQLNAEALIVGKLSPADGNRLQIAVAAAKTKGGDEIANLSVVVPFTDEMDARLTKTLIEDHTKNRLPPRSPMDSYPKCIYCPRAKFSDAAMTHRKEGIVVLVVLVGEDGVARDIEFVKGQQYGLTQKAIEAVQTWKFKPGHGPDGEPRAVWQTIEVSFHLRD
jgi:TonB family protein